MRKSKLLTLAMLCFLLLLSAGCVKSDNTDTNNDMGNMDHGKTEMEK